MKKNNAPDFLCVGAPKAGTTALCTYLSQHPDIFMPVSKEPRYFVRDYYRDLCLDDPRCSRSKSTVVYTEDDYRELFDTNINHQGEGSVQYLYLHEYAIPEIKRYAGDPKIIIMLRNPLQRALSSYMRAIRDGFESKSFLDSLLEEDFKVLNNWSLGHFHMNLGLYYQPVKAYLENFSNVKVLFYEDYCENQEDVIRSIYTFLNVDDSYKPNLNVRYNESGVPRARYIHDFLINPSKSRSEITRILRKVLPEKNIRAIKEVVMSLNLNKKKYSLSEKELNFLLSELEGDVKKLSRLLKRDLDHWLTV